MLKLLVPASLALAVYSTIPVEAARCPVGKIYRITLKVCAPRAANLQFLLRPKVQKLAHRDSVQKVDPRKLSATKGIAPKLVSTTKDRGQDRIKQLIALSETQDVSDNQSDGLVSVPFDVGRVAMLKSVWPPSSPYGALR